MHQNTSKNSTQDSKEETASLVNDFSRYNIIVKFYYSKYRDHKMDMVTNGTREKENPISGSDSISATKTVARRGSLKEKLTLSFIIKSTNLKILYPIGQGCITVTSFYECHNVFQLIR